MDSCKAGFKKYEYKCRKRFCVCCHNFRCIALFNINYFIIFKFCKGTGKGGLDETTYQAINKRF